MAKFCVAPKQIVDGVCSQCLHAMHNHQEYKFPLHPIAVVGSKPKLQGVGVGITVQLCWGNSNRLKVRGVGASQRGITALLN